MMTAIDTATLIILAFYVLVMLAAITYRFVSHRRSYIDPRHHIAKPRREWTNPTWTALTVRASIDEDTTIFAIVPTGFHNLDTVRDIREHAAYLSVYMPDGTAYIEKCILDGFQDLPNVQRLWDSQHKLDSEISNRVSVYTTIGD